MWLWHSRHWFIFVDLWVSSLFSLFFSTKRNIGLWFFIIFRNTNFHCVSYFFISFSVIVWCEQWNRLIVYKVKVKENISCVIRNEKSELFMKNRKKDRWKERQFTHSFRTWNGQNIFHELDANKGTNGASITRIAGTNELARTCTNIRAVYLPTIYCCHRLKIKLIPRFYIKSLMIR